MPLRYILETLASLSRQKSFLQKLAEPLLRDALYRRVAEKDKEKIRRYYGLAVPAILGESICQLHGRKMSVTERTCSTAQGAITGLFDDFFDEGSLKEEQIRSLWKDLPPNNSDNPAYMLFLYFLKKALDHAPDPEKMMQQFSLVHAAQEKSRLQTNPTISNDEIAQITWQKGGDSLLFYRTAFSNRTDESETRAWFALGALMQLCNDLFDVYKDREAGIHTLVTRASSIDELREIWLMKYREAIQEIQATPCQKSNVYHTLALLNTGIFSRSLVCLDQLKKLEAASDGVFRVNDYSRAQLICDMEKPANLWKSGRYISWLNRKASPA